MPQTLGQMRQALQEEWNNIPLAKINKLIDSRRPEFVRLLQFEVDIPVIKIKISFDFETVMMFTMWKINGKRSTFQLDAVYL